jgi:hypothetical protein
MIEGCDSLRFALEAVGALGIVGDVGREDLERDASSEPRIDGPVDLAHATLAEELLDLVRAESIAGHERHRLGEACVLSANEST